jgi:hypothetical protein
MTKILTHITDVGAAAGNGIDSTLRIEQQYATLGQQARVISAGHSPLHVAFAAMARLAPAAGKRAEQVATLLGQTALPQIPLALNSAPRNSEKSQPDGQENYIYRLAGASIPTMLVYGQQVVAWVNAFAAEPITAERVTSIGNIIPDTSRGSQFRSAEHLPIAHTLEAHGKLEEMATLEPATIHDLSEGVLEPGTVTVAPSDEYGNGRLVVAREMADEILAKDTIRLSELTDQAIVTRPSLTEVVPGELSVWPSSNYMPNPDIVVLNLGTRWSPGTTRSTDERVLALQPILVARTGQSVGVE